MVVGVDSAGVFRVMSCGMGELQRTFSVGADSFAKSMTRVHSTLHSPHSSLCTSNNSLTTRDTRDFFVSLSRGSIKTVKTFLFISSSTLALSNCSTWYWSHPYRLIVQLVRLCRCKFVRAVFFCESGWPAGCRVHDDDCPGDTFGRWVPPCAASCFRGWILGLFHVPSLCIG